MTNFDFFLGEDNFQSEMETTVAQYREQHYKEGMFLGTENHMIHYVYVPTENAKAAIVVSHGYCEFARKYDETIYYLSKMGYAVYFIEHLGHGLSHRLVEDPNKVHVKNFDSYVEDLHIFMDQVVCEKNDGLPLFLFAHSMGGGIGALFLEKYPQYFKAAVLSSPMLEVATGNVPKWMAYTMGFLCCLFGKGTDYAPTKHEFDNINIFPKSGFLSKARYDYAFKLRQEHEEYRTYGATMSWAYASLKAAAKARKNAAKVQIPVLLCQAELDTMVGADGQNYFAEKSGNTKLLRFADSKHEIFNATQEIREDFYKKIDEFYEEQF